MDFFSRLRNLSALRIKPWFFLFYLRLLICLSILTPAGLLAQASFVESLDSAGASEQESSTKCEFEGFSLAENAKIYAAGAYGGKELAYQIDQSGHQATQIDVAVNSPERPVVLLLGAYEPTIWNISWAKGTTISAVLVSGYHRQVIAGLSESVKVFNTSYDNRGPCGYFYLAADSLQGVNPMSRKVFGRAADKAFLAENGSVVVGEALPTKVELETSADSPPEKFFLADAPLAGPAGLKKAVEKGLIRRANEGDFVRWLEARQRFAPADIPPVEGLLEKRDILPRGESAFVILEKFTFPAGLYGAHSAIFILPDGVPEPEGDPGHSTVYSLNPPRCIGPLCRAPN